MTGNDLLDRVAGLGTIEAMAFVTFLVFTITFFLWVASLTLRR